ncbi:hypothetical protein GYMLUDRAFT_260093 [Collybiopsis luxurians FD-317 M1]|uniref:Uncharacterized protein n=1 Tax=Collybiopsis luxurians FD-317 M1 TaxID=944289 RepID=A0A0D0C3Y6_9AGAR|nr:hypothetical protein GYMLUDRAFT_260093 [Collybiopsis luxurians FD-317 M1]
MRFSTLSLIATVASAAFAFAAPSPRAFPATGAVEARSLHDISSIISGTTTSLTPLIQELYSIKQNNATVAGLTPVINDIESVLNNAITDVKALAGEALATILTTTEGVQLTVNDVALLVIGLVNLIFGAVYAVIQTVSALEAAVVYPLLASVLTLLATLIQLISGLIAGLLAELIPLVGDVITTVVASLGLTTTYAFLIVGAVNNA